MPERKTICRYCGKIADSKHNCPGKEKARQESNARRREYRRKNIETLKPLESRKWRKLRLRIIARDNHICQRCYIKYNIINGDQLQVHHIKPRIYYPELTFEEDNIITLCKTCNIQLGLNGIDFDWEPPVDDSFNL